MEYLKWRLSVFALFISVAPVGVKAFVPKDSDLQRKKAELDHPPAKSSSQEGRTPMEFETVRANLKSVPAKPEASQ